MKSPIRIAILDSGVHLNHPHIGGVTGGVDFASPMDAAQASTSFVDRLGHGTAVTALIHHLAPAAELFAVKIFDRRLATSLPIVLKALEWSLEQKVQIINLSMGTTNALHRSAFEDIVARAKDLGIVLISACEAHGEQTIPGSLPGVLGVIEDQECPGDEYRVVRNKNGVAFATSPYPRPIPGVPQDRNLHGVSFSTARFSAFVARFWDQYGAIENWSDFLISQVSNASHGLREAAVIKIPETQNYSE
ncbi:MAG: subtilisin-like serine protease QhpE [Acidobacteriaceae bacterium]